MPRRVPSFFLPRPTRSRPLPFSSEPRALPLAGQNAIQKEAPPMSHAIRQASNAVVVAASTDHRYAGLSVTPQLFLSAHL